MGDARRAALKDKYDAAQRRVENTECRWHERRKAANHRRQLQGGVRFAERAQCAIAVSRSEVICSIGADAVEANGYTCACYVAYSGATGYVALGSSNGS